MALTFPGESSEYRAARDRLLDREIALRRQMEALAAARRALPSGGLVPEDYVFDGLGANGAPAKIKLSELFGGGKSLVIYHFMFPRDPGDPRPGPQDGVTAELKLEEGPCPSCVALLDQLEGAASHIEGAEHNFVVIAKTSLDRLLTFAKDRGWRNLRLLSSGGSTFKRDYHGETAEGSQRPMLTVFQRDGSAIRHFWSSEMFYAPTEPGQDPRHVGTLEPLWNIFDFTPEGRPKWDEQLRYDCTCGPGRPG